MAFKTGNFIYIQKDSRQIIFCSTTRYLIEDIKIKLIIAKDLLVSEFFISKYELYNNNNTKKKDFESSYINDYKDLKQYKRI